MLDGSNDMPMARRTPRAAVSLSNRARTLFVIPEAADARIVYHFQPTLRNCIG